MEFYVALLTQNLILYHLKRTIAAAETLGKQFSLHYNLFTQ